MSDLERPAFYALRGGGWRDWWSLLHPPYTLWHLSYVCLGAAAAPRIHLDLLLAALAAFFLAMGLGAHALDELNGRPLRTSISSRALWMVATASIAGAVVLGIVYAPRVGWSAAPFIIFGTFIVAAYNLEWFGGAFHSDAWFAFAWGAFPAFTAAWAQSPRPHIAPVLVALACFFISAAQRALSTPVRALRRRARTARAEIEWEDGTAASFDRAALTRPAERALRLLSYAMPFVAAGAVVARYTR